MSLKSYFVLPSQCPALFTIQQDRSHTCIKNRSTIFDADIKIDQRGNSLNCRHVDPARAIIPCLIVPCPQNANILEIGDDEEFEIEYEHVDVDFVLMATRNTSRNFIEETKTSAVIDSACSETLAEEKRLQNHLKHLDGLIQSKSENIVLWRLPWRVYVT